MNIYNKILIATGGTGGHVFPAYSLAKYFLSKKISVKLISDKRGYKFLKNYSELDLKIIDSDTIFKKNPIRIIISLIVIIFALIRSFIYLVFNRPQIVFGMGGYSSFPICIASKILGIPFVIYENNLLLGKANKYLLPLAKKIFISYREIIGVKKSHEEKIFISGNIIRQEILDFLPQKTNRDKENLKILVLGGSQAAKLFGAKLPEIFKKCTENGIKIKIFQQCIEEQKTGIENFYRGNNISYELFNFSNNILEYFEKVDFVITRAGSSMLGELLNCKLPFISIPMEKSADNHQYINANYFESKGYSFLIREQEIESKLFRLIKSIHKDKSILDQIKKKQKNHSDKKTFDKINNEIIKIINGKN